MVEAKKLAFADREAYLADPEFVDVPIEGLLSPQYAADRSGLIDPEVCTQDVKEGDPWAYHGPATRRVEAVSQARNDAGRRGDAVRIGYNTLLRDRQVGQRGRRTTERPNGIRVGSDCG